MSDKNIFDLNIPQLPNNNGHISVVKLTSKEVHVALKLAIGSDHGGYQLKKEIMDYLKQRQVAYQDFGAYSTDAVDYPDLAQAVAQAVAQGEFQGGILCCGTGIGVCIAANKVPGIRAALCHDTFSARMAVEHNQANIITMGERVIGAGLAKDIVAAWLDAEFAGEPRHVRRVDKMMALEKINCS